VRAAEALKAAGYDARQPEEFRGAKDVDWLPKVGEARWVVITKDKNIRRNQLEIDAFLNAGVRAFVITAGNVNREDQVTLLLRVMPKLLRICRRSTRALHFQHHGDRTSNTSLKSEAPTPQDAEGNTRMINRAYVNRGAKRYC
jgi:PIN like domain